MEGEIFTVIQNFEDEEELDLTTADLSTIIEVPTLEPFILTNENVLGNINNPLDVGHIHGDLLDNLNDMELCLECDDDRNYDMNDINKDANFLPTALVGNNVRLHISFSNNASIKQEEKLKDKFVCSVCQEKFKIETKFRRHMLHCHQIINPFPCESCSYAASSTRLLTKHVYRRHIKIEKCEKVECSTDNLHPAETKETLDDFENVSSTKTFDSEANVNLKPEKDVTTENSDYKSDKCDYKCDKCDNTCKQKKYLALHSKRHAPTNDSQFQCLVCNKMFLTSVSLKRHSKTHIETRPFVCVYQNCNKSFKIKGALTDHERYVHGKSKLNTKGSKNESGNSEQNITVGGRKQSCRSKPERKFKCTFKECGKLFRDSYNLRNHLAIHTGTKGLSCPHCSFTCVQNASLKWHIKSKHNK